MKQTVIFYCELKNRMDSFEVGDKTWMEIEKQMNANLAKTPLTSKAPPKNEKDEVVEESPNAKENASSSLNQLSLHERLRNANQTARQRRKLEKTRSSPATKLAAKKTGLSSISNLLDADNEHVDMSSWQKSVAQLITPTVRGNKVKENLDDFDDLKFDCSESQDLFKDEDCWEEPVNSKASNDYGEINKNTSEARASDDVIKESDDIFSQDPLDLAISGDSSATAFDDVDCSMVETDNVSFVQPQDSKPDHEATRHIDQELLEQKSMLQSSEMFHNTSVTSHSISIRRSAGDSSLKVDS